MKCKELNDVTCATNGKKGIGGKPIKERPLIKCKLRLGDD
jgi:hypothetical protein